MRSIVLKRNVVTKFVQNEMNRRGGPAPLDEGWALAL